MENNRHSHFHFRFSEEHLITSLLRHRQQVWWRIPFIGLKWFLAAVLGACLVLVVYLGYGTMAGVIGGILGVLLLGWPIDVWNMRRGFRKSPYHNDEITFSLSESGSQVVGRDSEVRIGWASYTKARRFGDGLLLFQGPGFVNWLPDSAAVDKSAIANAQELARLNIRDYREV
jgi:hypothetical protein